MQAHFQRSKIMRHGAKLLSLLVPVMLCCLLPGPVQGAVERVGTVIGVTGKASIERQGSRWYANVEDPVFLGDKVETALSSTLEILFADGSRVRMASRASLEITRYLYDPAAQQRDSLLSLWSGKARFMVNDLEGFREKRFQVQTHTGIVGTRDTDFIAHTFSNVMIKVLGLIRPIIFCNRLAAQNSKCCDVNPFYTSEQRGVEPPTPPRLVTPEELDDWLADVTTREEAGRFRNLYRRDIEWFRDFPNPGPLDQVPGPGGWPGPGPGGTELTDTGLPPGPGP